MKNCDYCGVGNKDDAGWCVKCGAPFSQHHLDFGRSTLVWDKVKNAVGKLTVSPTSWPVVGMDISHHQGRINWEIARQLIQFAIIKAGGNDNGIYEDIMCKEHMAGARDFGIAPGLYWYSKVVGDPLKSAQGFFNVWAKYPWAVIFPSFDFEHTTMGAIATTEWIHKTIVEFLRLSGLQFAMDYTSPGWWNFNTVANDWARELLLIWVAHWTNYSSPTLPRDWKGLDYSFWQYSAGGNRLASKYGAQYGPDIDLDRFPGSVSVFNSLFHTNISEIGGNPAPIPVPTPTPVPVPIPGPVNKSVTINTTALNIRANPDANSTILGALPLNTKVHVCEEANGWYKLDGWISKSFTK